MNTKLATSRMRTGQWADIIKDCKASGLKESMKFLSIPDGFTPPVRPCKPSIPA